MTTERNGQLFGTQLRLWRLTTGMSLAELARRIHYTKGHISKVETGKKPATAEFARLVDTAMNASGQLSKLLPAKATDEHSPPAAPPRGLTVNTADMLAGIAPVSVQATAPRSADGAARDFTQCLRQARSLGQRLSPGVMIPLLDGHLRALSEVIAVTTTRHRPGLFRIAARFMEYSGWMAQEAGDDGAAMHRTERAVQLAREGDDAAMAGHALVREALLAMYKQDARLTVTLARRAQTVSRGHPHVHACAMVREGQGHALAGDYDRFCAAMDRAEDHMDRETDTDGLVLGSSFVSDPVRAARGWSLYDLGRPVQGATILESELAALPSGATRAYSRFATRCALQHAIAGELDRACELARSVAGRLECISSATIRHDVRRLVSTLGRWRGDPRVGPVLTELRLVLHNLENR